MCLSTLGHDLALQRGITTLASAETHLARMLNLCWRCWRFREGSAGAKLWPEAFTARSATSCIQFNLVWTDLSYVGNAVHIGKRRAMLAGTQHSCSQAVDLQPLRSLASF